MSFTSTTYVYIALLNPSPNCNPDLWLSDLQNGTPVTSVLGNFQANIGFAQPLLPVRNPVAASTAWLDSVMVARWTCDCEVVGSTQSGCHQVVTAWKGDCLRTGKPSWYITNTKVNSAFHPFGVGKSSTGLSGWGWAGPVFLCHVAGNTVWSHMADDAP